MRLRALPFVIAVLLALAMAVAAGLSTATKHALHTQGSLHPWLHLLGFGLVTLLLVSSTRSNHLRLAFFVLMLLFGYGTELFESHRDGWAVEFSDVAIDAMGTALGAVLSMMGRSSDAPH